MRIGCLVNLSHDVEASFAEARELGFHSGQLVVWDMSLYCEEIAQRVLNVCREIDFEITAVWCGWSGPVVWSYPDMYNTLGLVPAYLRGQRLFDLMKGCEFAHRLGVKHVVSHIGYFPDNPFDKDHVEIVHCMRHLCSALKARGQSFLFETGEELPVTLLRLIDEIGTGNLGVNFDPANLLMSGRANAADALTMFRGCLLGMHAKDGVYPEPGQGKGKERRLGEGQANFPVLIRLLKEFGYEGDITIEREIPDLQQRRLDIAYARELLTTWIKEA